MTSFSFLTSIILTYKGKLLLLSPDLDPTRIQQHLWCFIGGERAGKESSEEIIHRKIRYTTKLRLGKIQRLITPTPTRGKHFYHGELTDSDVNTMERREGQRLEFFTLRELGKLSLTESTQGFLTDYRGAVEKLFA